MPHGNKNGKGKAATVIKVEHYLPLHKKLSENMHKILIDTLNEKQNKDIKKRYVALMKRKLNQL